MAIPHAKSGDVLRVGPLESDLESSQTSTLIKTQAMEVIRLVMPAGKEIAEHQAPGEITVQCLEGRVEFEAGDAARELAAGDLIYLEAGVPHALRAAENSSLLLTILLRRKSE